jgi:hypothetical protein
MEGKAEGDIFMEISTFKVSTHFRELRNYRHVLEKRLDQKELT